MGYELGKEREAIFLGLHGTFSGRDATSGRREGSLDAWKASESHFQWRGIFDRYRRVEEFDWISFCGVQEALRDEEVFHPGKGYFHSHPIGVLAKAQKKVVGMAL